MNIEDLHGMQLPGAALINSAQVLVMFCRACGKAPEVVALEVYVPDTLKLCCAECGGGIQVIGRAKTRNFLTKLPEILEAYRENVEEMQDKRRRAANEYMEDLQRTMRVQKMVATKVHAAKPGK